MWKTALLLIVSLIVLPFLALRFDRPLDAFQRETLQILLWIYLSAALLCFVVSSLSRNYSQVDKLWSLIPLAYVWVIAFRSGMEPRLMLMAALVTLWGLRLTFNFARRGGYSWRFWSGEEDYRWAVLRAKPELQAPWRWMLFNFFFISLYQMGLIQLFTLPALRAAGSGALNFWDGFLMILFLALLLVETVADQQQWRYHKEKRRLGNSGHALPAPYDKGFVHTGLWGIVRHPNYAAEQAIWIVFYFFSVSATGAWLNWSVMGGILLVLLFWGSSQFSESISAGKYPGYAGYQKRVPRFIPRSI